ncbi:MAG: tetratricopeptide repeat protein [Kiritimatiellia bacterium]|nr:tetratricopeptide repeat protein [Kiritimatiellia bacterium]
MSLRFNFIRFFAVLGMALGIAAPAICVELPPSSANYGVIKTQRIRFNNALLFKKANAAVNQRNDTAAIQYFNEILRNDPGSNPAKLALIALYERMNRYDDGIRLCDELIGKYPDFIDTYCSKGYLAMKGGKYDLAAAAWQAGLNRAPADFSRRLEILKALGQAYARLGRYDDVVYCYAQALTIEKDPRPKLELGLFIAGLFIEQQRPADARAWLEKVASFAGSDIRWPLAMARVDFLAGDYRACCERLIILKRRPPVVNLLLGFAFMKRDMPGPALEFLNEINKPDMLKPGEQLSLFRNRAYLNFDQSQYAAAIIDSDVALGLKPSVDMALVHLKSLANVSVSNDIASAGEYLLKPGESGMFLTGAEQAQVLLVMGRHLNQKEQYDNAVQRLTDVVKLAPSLAEPFYLRGLAYHALGKSKEAVTNYQEYVRLETNPPATFWGDLGQAEGKQREYKKGTAALQRSLGYHSVDVATLSDQGYQFMKWNHNRESKEAFGHAIDFYADLVPRVPTNETVAYREREVGMKQEYTKLDHLFGIQGYVSRTDYGFPTNVGISSVDGALPSQYGLELSFRPPVVGFFNEKTLDVFGQVTGNFRRQNWTPDPDSYQGMLGLRLKPFERLNYNMSFARLFKIGDNAEDNWLWRNMASWERGSKPAPGKTVGLNLKLFGDVGYYFDPRVRWYGYLDGRAGPSVRLRQNAFLILPQVMGIMRYETNDKGDTGSYGLAGIGATLRLFEKETRYTINRLYVDIFAYYTWGEFMSTPSGFDGRSFDGVMFGINLVK